MGYSCGLGGSQVSLHGPPSRFTTHYQVFKHKGSLGVRSPRLLRLQPKVQPRCINSKINFRLFPYALQRKFPSLVSSPEMGDDPSLSSDGQLPILTRDYSPPRQRFLSVGHHFPIKEAPESQRETRLWPQSPEKGELQVNDL
jgi:hypothetical protein